MVALVLYTLAFSSGSEWGLPPVEVCGTWPSVCGGFSCLEHSLQDAGSVIVVCGLSYPEECGIFPDQESNRCTLHWQVDSSPVDHQGSPVKRLLKIISLGKYS